jgi:hypothetical protein
MQNNKRHSINSQNSTTAQGFPNGQPSIPQNSLVVRTAAISNTGGVATGASGTLVATTTAATNGSMMPASQSTKKYKISKTTKNVNSINSNINPKTSNMN